VISVAVLEGEIWLTDSTANRLALEQISLLQAIRDTGSISAAAKTVGISYKTAWDRVERLNNLSKSPLVARASGGNKGGGTSLTNYGTSLLQGFSELKAQHQLFLRELNKRLHSLDDITGFVKHSNLQASARNQLLGTITALETGSVNTEVVLDIADSLQLIAQISEHSRQEMDLRTGEQVLALIKASSVTLSTSGDIRVSARNCYRGTIVRLERGAVNADVSIDVGGNKTLSAMITNTSCDQLQLTEGNEVTAFFKASSVILMRI